MYAEGWKGTWLWVELMEEFAATKDGGWQAAEVAGSVDVLLFAVLLFAVLLFAVFCLFIVSEVFIEICFVVAAEYSPLRHPYQ